MTRAGARDPITAELVKNALASLVDEMAYTVIQTAHSEIVKDVMDFSTAVCDARGRMLAQGKTIAMHLGAVPDAMEAVGAAFGTDVHDGDVIVLNDPYEGGMHLPDVFMLKPVFSAGELAGWAVVIVHQTDMGGRIPGSNASDSTEIFQEGLRIPPLKLYERGSRNRTLLRILEKNVRVPERVTGDWAAQLSACRIGERGLLELIARYGRDELEEYFEHLLDYSERMLRQEIGSWPDGRYEFTDSIDDDGFGGGPIALAVALEVRGDSLVVDWSGSSPQVKGAINPTFSFTKSCTYLSVRCVMREDIPNNAGFFRPIEVRAPEGSIANPRPPAACAARALTGYRMVDTMFGALARIVPDRVPAAGEGGNTVVCLSGFRPGGDRFIVVDMLCGAWGGRPDRDGVDAITNPAQNLSNTPVEVLEAEHPILVRRYGFVTDSCGAGRFRGGLSIERDYEVLVNEALLQLRSDRAATPPWGLAGGGAGAPAHTELVEGGAHRGLASKVTMPLARGQVLEHRMAGGGGHGDPFQRPPAQVLEDVLDERISAAYALREHGVVIGPDGVLDDRATAERRRSRHEARPGES
jgi:N-methylhydantoinase B